MRKGMETTTNVVIPWQNLNSSTHSLKFLTKALQREAKSSSLPDIFCAGAKYYFSSGLALSFLCLRAGIFLGIKTYTQSMVTLIPLSKISASKWNISSCLASKPLYNSAKIGLRFSKSIVNSKEKTSFKTFSFRDFLQRC